MASILKKEELIVVLIYLASLEIQDVNSLD